ATTDIVLAAHPVADHRDDLLRLTPNSAAASSALHPDSSPWGGSLLQRRLRPDPVTSRAVLARLQAVCDHAQPPGPTPSQDLLRPDLVAEPDNLAADAALAGVEIDHDWIAASVVGQGYPLRAPPDRLDRPLDLLRFPVGAEPVPVVALPVSVHPPHRLDAAQG